MPHHLTSPPSPPTLPCPTLPLNPRPHPTPYPSYLLPKDGRYLFELIAVDAAQLQLGPKDFSIIRDTQGPTLRIITPQPQPGVKLPRRVTVQFLARDSLSGVVAADAMLQKVGGLSPGGVIRGTWSPGGEELHGGFGGQRTGGGGGGLFWEGWFP